MQVGEEQNPKGAITLQRLSRSFETADDDDDDNNNTTTTNKDDMLRRRSKITISETELANEPRDTTNSFTMESATPTKPMAATVWDAKDYSDLEVVVEIPPTWNSNDKMPVLVDTSEEKIAHVVAPTNNTLLSPSSADPVPAYPASLHSRTSTYTNSPLTKSGDYVEYEQHDVASTRSNEKKIWGMGHKQLSLVAAGLLGFILVLLATVLAITLSMNNKPSGSAPASAPINGTQLLNSSSLAALNWTDTTGLDRSLVFYQDAGDSILVSIRDSASNEWAITNVTQAVMNSTGAKRLDVLSGTPLACVTNAWQVSLYYLTTHNFISEIWSSDVAAGNWYAGSLAADLNPEAMNGTKLSAYWNICTNCTNSLVVLHQQVDGNLMLANFTNNNWELSGPVASSASQPVNQTGLAIRPVAEGNGTNSFGTEPTGWRVYGFDDTGIVELENGRATNYTWEMDFASKFPRQSK